MMTDCCYPGYSNNQAVTTLDLKEQRWRQVSRPWKERVVVEGAFNNCCDLWSREAASLRLPLREGARTISTP